MADISKKRIGTRKPLLGSGSVNRHRTRRTKAIGELIETGGFGPFFKKKGG